MKSRSNKPETQVLVVDRCTGTCRRKSSSSEGKQLACLHDQNKNDFFRGPAFFQQIGAF